MNDAVKPVSVLLVEDSDEDVFFFRRAMSKYGEPADVTLVGDGKAAVAFLADPEKRKTIDVVFLDLKLPLMNGFEVLKWIRGHVPSNSLP